jgi:CelD/BcsL family acetyltransferase involved in cellulose biosynthesis
MKWTFHDAGEFPRFAEAWREVNARGHDLPALDPAFIGPLLSEMGSGHELLGVYGDGDRIGAFGLFVKRTAGSWRTFQAGYCPFGAWVIDPALPVEPVLSALVRALPGAAMLVSVTFQDPDIVPRASDEGCIRTVDTIRIARITVSGGFDDYWRTRTRNFRQNFRKSLNRLERESVAVRFKSLTAPEHMAAALDDYARVEISGWKADAGRAMKRDNPQGRFYKKMMTGLAHRGEAIVYCCYYDDHLVASDLCIKRNGVLTVLRTSYDDAERATSPGTLLNHHVFRTLFEEKLHRIEFYGALMDWHTNWTDEIRTMYHLNCYRWPLLASIHDVVRGRGAGGADAEDTEWRE